MPWPTADRPSALPTRSIIRGYGACRCPSTTSPMSELAPLVGAMGPRGKRVAIASGTSRDAGGAGTDGGQVRSAFPGHRHGDVQRAGAGARVRIFERLRRSVRRGKDTTSRSPASRCRIDFSRWPTPTRFIALRLRPNKADSPKKPSLHDPSIADPSWRASSRDARNPRPG